MMGKKQLLALALASAFALQARDPECRTMKLNVGPLVNFARYSFDCTPDIQGALVGLHFDFQHSKQCREFVQLRFDGRWSAGKIDGCDLEDRIRDYRPEFDFGWNFDWTICERDVTFTPFFGIGYIALLNQFKECSDSCFSNCCSNSCSDSCTSCREELNYGNLYVPIGFNSVHKVSDCFSWGITAEYRIDARTRLKVSRDCCTLCDDIKPDSRTQGVLIEVPFMWQLTDGECYDWLIKFVPQFDFNKFGAGKCDCSCTCDSTCSPCTSSCCSQNVLDAILNCDVDVTDGCKLPQLKEWYLGAHLDVGVRF